MRAEIEYKGETELLTLPENTVFVNFKAHRTDGNSENDLAIIGTDVNVIEEMLCCTAVKIETEQHPIDFEVHAFVDPDGKLAVRLAPYAGMEMMSIRTRDYRFTVTV